MKILSRVTSVLVALALGLSTLVFTQPAQASFRSTYGTEFWVHFDQNAGWIPGRVVAPALFIASPASGTATVTWPSGSTLEVPLVAGEVATVDAFAEIVTADKYADEADGVESVAVKVTATTAISVYLSNRVEFISEASIAYPSSYLGTTYRVLNFNGNPIPTFANRFSVTAVQSGTTTLDITLASTASGTGRSAGSNYQVTLEEGETYSLAGNGLFGTLIDADQKVAVSATNGCVRIDIGACDYITEFMTPVETWGKEFILASSRNEANNDHFLVLAHQDGTELTLNGDNANKVTISAGQVHDFYGGLSSALVRNFDLLSSNKPVLVLQVLTGGTYRNDDLTSSTTGDPAAHLVQPTQQFLNDAIISTPAEGFNVNYLTIVAKSSDVSGGLIKLNNVVIPSSKFTTAGLSGYSIARLDIAVGTHRVQSTNGFAAYVTGFGISDGYSYSGGTGLVDLVQFPGGVAEVGYQTVEGVGQNQNNSSTGDVSRDVERASWSGPIVERSSSPNNAPGGTAQFPGERHEQIEKVFLDGKEVTFKLVSGQLVIDVPRDQASGTYDLVVTGDFGTLRIQDALSIAGTAKSELIGKKAWTSIKAEKSAVRVIYKNPVNEGKVQFMLNGKEIAWARAVSDDDPKLRKYTLEGVEIPYLVRNVVLTPGIKNAFEIYVDGVRVWRAAYTLR